MSEIIKFGNKGIEVKIDKGSDGKEDIWLSADKIAALFDKEYSNVAKHINKIYKEEEVNKNTFKSFYVITEKNGKKYKKEKREYNLDVILSILYRINGKTGIQFRKWATEILGKYINKVEFKNIVNNITSSSQFINNVGYIYIIESQGLYKIGKTINIENRLKKYITENPNEVNLIHHYQVNNYSLEEEKLHKRFSKKRVRGEWFKLDKLDLNKIYGL